MSYIYPDRYFNRITDIDIYTDIIDAGYESILLDVDNTILTRDRSIVPNDVKEWLTRAQDEGLKICLISNDWHSNVVDAAKSLDLPIVVKSLKPLPHAFFIALKKIGANKSKSIMIGDQLVTDVFGAHTVGLTCFLVKPLVSQDLAHTLILRKVENIVLKQHQPEGVKKGKCHEEEF